MRTYQYRMALAEHGIEMAIAPLFGEDYVRTLYGGRGRYADALSAYSRRITEMLRRSRYDALWIEKEALPWLPALIEFALLPRHLPFILDYDDAVFHRYDMHSSPIVRWALGRKLDRLMARAALVVAGNDYLADRARLTGVGRIAIVPTVVDLERYQPAFSPHPGPLTIGWIGSPTTVRYLERIKTVINGLVRAPSIRALAIGARPEQLAGSAFEAVPWSEETEVADLRALDIGIMPLDDSPWERGKCGYKLIQYMAVGIPVVASPVGVNQKIVTHGENGFLADTESDWRDALASLLADGSLRRKMGAAGREKVEKDYSLATSAPRLAALIRETLR